MNAKLQDFIKNLKDGTQAGALKWTETPEIGVYRLILDKGLVRLYHLGPMSVGENFVGCTVLKPDGDVLHDVQVSWRAGGSLVTLYDLVDGIYEEGDCVARLVVVSEKREVSKHVV